MPRQRLHFFEDRRLNTYVLPLAAALIAGIVAVAGTFWLWREYTLYAVTACAFALLGGTAFFSRQDSSRIVVIGVGAGLLLGSLLALHGA
jgi:peptidoglycan/LPS O-acetylase OafA/YrhL